MEKLYSQHPVMFRSRPFLFILALILSPIGVGLVIFLVWYIINKNTQFSVTERAVEFETGVFAKNHAEISLSSIRSIKVNQSLLNRIFGVGTLELYTAGDNPEIVAHGMPDPNGAREIVSKRIR